MTTEYKNLALDLKYQYEAKVRLLKLYRVVYYALLKPVYMGGKLVAPSEKEMAINSISLSELSKLLFTTKEELRTIHLARAFIKGIPYKVLEPKCTLECDTYAIGFIFVNNVQKHYSKKIDIGVIWEELDAWYLRGIPSKFFAKPKLSAKPKLPAKPKPPIEPGLIDWLMNGG